MKTHNILAEWWDTRDLAWALDINQESIRKWIRNKTIEFIQTAGGRVLFHRTLVYTLISNRAIKPGVRAEVILELDEKEIPWRSL